MQITGIRAVTTSLTTPTRAGRPPKTQHQRQAYARQAWADIDALKQPRNWLQTSRQPLEPGSPRHAALFSRELKPAGDGGPPWSESLFDGQTYQWRRLPANDGRPDWTQWKNQRGQIWQTREYREDGLDWHEQIYGENHTSATRCPAASSNGRVTRARTRWTSRLRL